MISRDYGGHFMWPALCVWLWWRHQMETFSSLLASCAGNSPIPSEFPAQWPVTRSFDVFFGLLPRRRLSKQWWGWWFETPSRPLCRHCSATATKLKMIHFVFNQQIITLPGLPNRKMPCNHVSTLRRHLRRWVTNYTHHKTRTNKMWLQLDGSLFIE